MVGSGGQRAAERTPPFVPAVTKAGELREEAVAGRCGGRRGREEAATLVVEVEVRRPERALELAHAPTRPRLGSWRALAGPQRRSSPTPRRGPAAELAGTWQPQPLHGASDLHRWREKMHFCIAVGLLGKMPALLPLLLERVFHPKNTMPNAFLLLHGVVEVSLMGPHYTVGPNLQKKKPNL